ncbi:SusC/RagA family TonB-linked outer membrane protein [Geofilum rubicundum]|uniref:SusC, outer membrane protein n=1 Tax=Geofilum rubicundum JCM 15548 TaxID=1236989 RepID=A0A0E9LY60_9BACT|nr:TonB-dependent receptor [Geofilum rubicundum]GAO30238.1 SusC, outer membrane protein [Geofilum rubicundum JCM 15548]
MKKITSNGRRLGMLLLMWSIALLLSAQQKEVSGKIIEASSGESIPGATIIIEGTQRGVISDINGDFSIPVSDNETLVISYLGYKTLRIPVSGQSSFLIRLESEIISFDEVVVIGYGMQRKGDLTGAISNVNSKDFNKGIISSPEQLINGKVSGVQIMSNSGSPTAGSSIRIRGGASLNASNDPLIVLDGVPLEQGGISGNNNNFLSLINPNDIESMTVLKDASSTAIYGSRASNGVIIITTKKGSSARTRVSFSSTNSLQVKTKLADMLSTQEFRNVVNNEGTPAQRDLLGSSNTNWNDEIFQVAFGTDNNLSLSGQVQNLPYRLSLGYYSQDGILKTDNAERFTGNLSVSPTFFDEHLKLNMGIKGSLNRNQFAAGAIWGGATFNPTIPVSSGSPDFGGYTEAIASDGTPVTSAVINPVGLLKQYHSSSDVNRVISNFDLDYKFHFLPELRFHTTLGYDYAEGKGAVFVPASAAQFFVSGGRDYQYGPQKKDNQLLTTYFNYNNQLDKLNSTLDITAGYDFQSWKSTSAYYEVLNVDGQVQNPVAAQDQRHTLLSYYGRINYALASRYMVTATVRKDGTSRFNEGNRWGTFPSLALAWRLSEESFLKGLDVLSNLKLRASYGITGQQEGIGNYGYLPVYTISQTGAQYIFGNTPINTYRPEAYVSNLKWETTKSYNYGLDFGLFNNRLSGAIEYYTRQTEDLLATVPSPAGTNFDKTILTNVGNVDSEGIEFELNATPVANNNWTWDLSLNASWLTQTIKNLSIIEGTEITNSSAGPTIDSYYFQVLTEGYAPNMFYVYHQLYDESGQPIEGAYADVDGNGLINSDDLYRYNSPAPDYILGFSTSVRYKEWTMGTSLRANIGNYVYNGMSMNTGALGTMSYNSYQLNNLNKSYLETGFKSRQYLSDYYVENASFLKMDNLTLNYNFGQITHFMSLNATAMVQNIFTITNYTGVDPEVPNGMDASFYPRPRIFSLSLGMEF